MPPQEPDLTEAEKLAVSIAREAFEGVCRSREAAGIEEYGVHTYLENDTIRMAIEEVADLHNYALMTGTKLMLLAAGLQDSGVRLSEPFKGTKEGWGT